MSRELIQQVEENEQPWLVTYADLITLLLVFFILLFSMSSLQKERFVETINSFQEAVQGSGSGGAVEIPEPLVESEGIPVDIPPSVVPEDPDLGEPNPDTVALEPDAPVVVVDDPTDHDNIVKLKTKLEDTLSESGSQKDAKVGEPKDGKIVINVRGNAFFDGGSADFKRSAMPLMDGVVSILRQNPDYKLSIRGHTDNVPIRTARFPSNWELSAVRATSVLKYFVRGGIAPDRLSATGYGESLPITDNSTPELRAENRRLEFVLERIQP